MSRHASHVTSYRLRCQQCPNDEVINEEDIEDSPWNVIALHFHEGICPACNESIDLDPDSKYARDHQPVPFEDLDNIGSKGAESLREEHGIETIQDVKNASDDDILAASWVGAAGLDSIREYVTEEPDEEPEEDVDDTDPVPFEELNHIGEKGATGLRRKNIITERDVDEATDDEILETAWVGEAGLDAIREYVA